MRKLFIAFSLLSVLAAPAFADSDSISVAGLGLSKATTADHGDLRPRDTARGMNAGGGLGVSNPNVDRNLGERANGNQGGAAGAKGKRA